jgi:hypothetical protein
MVQHLVPEGFVNHLLDFVVQRRWLVILPLSYIGLG